MTARPLLQKGIVDLEKMFSESQGDHATLRRLRAELKHRKLARAFMLLKKVEAALMATEEQPGTTSEVPEKSVAPRVEGTTHPENLKVAKEPSKEIKLAGVLIPASTHQATERGAAAALLATGPDAGAEWVGSWPQRRAPISLTLEESYRILEVAPTSSWEVVEQARRTLVERSRPDLIAELSEGQREKAQADAHRVNQAYLRILK